MIKSITTILITIFVLTGCATWKGVKKDSSTAWDATKKTSKKAWSATKEGANEAYDSTKEVIHEATADKEGE